MFCFFGILGDFGINHRKPIIQQDRTVAQGNRGHTDGLPLGLLDGGCREIFATHSEILVKLNNVLYQYSAKRRVEGIYFLALDNCS